MADEIFIINVGGYVGSGTKSEIEYAREAGKKSQLPGAIGRKYM